MEGFISVHRKIFKNWVWDDKPFSRGQAWIDILLMANHKENKFPLGNELVTVERGSFITSELKLMERWGWGKGKTRNFLKLLEDDGMIIKKVNHKRTTITVCNYNVYQLSADQKQTDNGLIADQKQTDNGLKTDTNNNVNKDNNDNNVNNQLTNEVVSELAKHYSDCFRRMIPPIHKDTLMSFIEDGMEIELVKYVMEYSIDKKEPWKYCKKVLENSATNMITTLEDFKANLKLEEGEKDNAADKQGYKYTEPKPTIDPSKLYSDEYVNSLPF